MNNKKFYQIGMFISLFSCITSTAGSIDITAVLNSLPTEKQEAILEQSINNFLEDNKFVSQENQPNAVVSKYLQGFSYVPKPNTFFISLQEASKKLPELEFNVLRLLGHFLRNDVTNKIHPKGEELLATGMATTWATNQKTCNAFINSLRDQCKTDPRPEANPNEQPTPSECIEFVTNCLQFKKSESLKNKTPLINCIVKEIEEQTKSDK